MGRINAFTIRDEHDREVMELETLRPTAPTATCQICARAIKAPFGLIAHHGYQRAGWGWTASCPGARAVPYEQGKGALEQHVRGLVEHIQNLQAQRKNCEDERKDIPLWVLLQKGRTLLLLNRLNFSDEMARLPGRDTTFSFDKLKAGHLRGIDEKIAMYQSELASQRKRIALWRCPPDLTLEDLSL